MKTNKAVTNKREKLAALTNKDDHKDDHKDVS